MNWSAEPYFGIHPGTSEIPGNTVEQARKILGNDFDTVWKSLELILTQDEDGTFYIEWLRNSIEKRQKHADLQRLKIQRYWDNKKKDGNTTVIPQNYPGNSTVIPLENENGNINIKN